VSIVQRIAQRVSVGGAKDASRAIDIDAGDSGIIEAKPLPGQISALYPYIRPAVDQAGPDLDAAIKANAKIQATLLRQSSPVLAEHISHNQLKIVAGYYDLASGMVTVLD
jgi:hypothetical protein